MEAWLLYGGGAVGLGIVSLRLYRAYSHKTRRQLMHEVMTLAFVTWVFFVPLIHALMLVGRARGAQRAWAAGHKLCSVGEDASALAGHAATRNFCVDAAGHDRPLIAIWFDLLWERGPIGLWTGSTYDEMMREMETASLQRYFVRLVGPIGLVVLAGVYVMTSLGLGGGKGSPQVVDRGDRLCFRGLGGGEVCVHKTQAAATA